MVVQYLAEELDSGLDEYCSRKSAATAGVYSDPLAVYT
jgi:hypothetical protein